MYIGNTELRFQELPTPTSTTTTTNNIIPPYDSAIPSYSDNTTNTTTITDINLTPIKTYKLISSKETLNLIRSIDNNTLKNRKLAIDLLEYIDSCKPPSIGMDAWNDAIVRRVDLKGVPG